MRFHVWQALRDWAVRPSQLARELREIFRGTLEMRRKSLGGTSRRDARLLRRRRRWNQTAVPAFVQSLEPRVVLSSSPVVVVTSPVTINEGEKVNLSAAGSYDPDGSPLTYSWDFNNDYSYDAYGETVEYDSAQWGTANGAHPIHVTVYDGNDPSSYGDTTVTVNNLAPTWSTAPQLNTSHAYPGDMIHLTAEAADA
jgi:hypothetical protein